MKITSIAFDHHGSIPSKYTCDGDDINPPLTFEDVPPNTASLALIMDDPDVPEFVRPDRNWDHWIAWNLAPDIGGIEEAQRPHGVVGRNSWGVSAYGGPAPPDREHRYFFKLYALDTRLDLSPNAGKKDLERAMEGHVIETAELVGRYERVGVHA